MGNHLIRSVGHRKILDSHLGWTNEFIVELEDGSCGTGSSSRGETIGIYEDSGATIDPRKIIDVLARDSVIGGELDLPTLERYLQGKIASFGKNTCFALSLAFFDASLAASGRPVESNCHLPRLCLNVLNGGWHAYTNPVLSDFHEFIIVPKRNDLAETIKDHNALQALIKDRLVTNQKEVVSGNPVNRFAERSNAAVLGFLTEMLAEAGLSERYDLMLDASGTDLQTPHGYEFPITGDHPRSWEALLDYWLELIGTYSLGFLEDPFHEKDLEAWTELTRQCSNRCVIVGDNLYSSEAARIERGSREGHSSAVLIKPNQAGTVSATVAAIEVAVAGGLTPITSHRSISTESTFVSDVTCEYRVPYIKIGPLNSDYSSVVRLNRLIRLSGAERE